MRRPNILPNLTMTLRVIAEFFPWRMLPLLPHFSYLMSRGLFPHPGQLSRESQQVWVLGFWVQQGQDGRQAVWPLVISVTHLWKQLSPPKVGCTKNSTRRIRTASSCGSVGNEEAAHSLGGLKAVMWEAGCKDSVTLPDPSTPRVAFWKWAGLSTPSTTVKRQEFWCTRTLRLSHGQT